MEQSYIALIQLAKVATTMCIAKPDTKAHIRRNRSMSEVKQHEHDGRRMVGAWQQNYSD